MSGTFDPIDLAAYAIASALALLLHGELLHSLAWVTARLEPLWAIGSAAGSH